MLYLHANLQPMFSSGTICIGGLPGIGSVGKVAADFLATALECYTVKAFFSNGFPAQVVVADGLTSLLHAELKVPKNKDDLFILSGDAQPLDIQEMHALAGEILEAARDLKVTDIITLAAYVGDKKEKVVGAASDLKTAAELEKKGIPLLCSGAIGGINGLLAGCAPLYGIRGICILGTTTGENPLDIGAAKNLLRAVLPIISLDISLDALEIDEPLEAQHEESDMYYR
jgi:proteasome assembly chaperone (PAC2) family protein